MAYCRVTLLLGHVFQKTKLQHKISQSRRCTCRDWKSEPPKYKSKVLWLELPWSLFLLFIQFGILGYFISTQGT